MAGIGGDTTVRPWLRAVQVLSQLPTFVLELSWDLDAVVRLIDDIRRATSAPT
jgi:hypothetical protein